MTSRTTPPLVSVAGAERPFDAQQGLIDRSQERWNLLVAILADVIPPRKLSEGLRAAGCATALLEMDAAALAEAADVPPDTAERFSQRCESDPVRVAAAREARLLDEHGVRLIGRCDSDYPRLLSWTPVAPPALWVWGDYRIADGFAVAVAGASRCDAYGREQAQRLGRFAADQGLTLVTSGERGVDAEALAASLEGGGRNLVALGAGLLAHGRTFHELYRRAARQGAVVSTVPMQQPPDSINQVAGDQLTTGLSLALVVVQSGNGGGALISARMAAEARRDVLALPGRLGDPTSQGSNQLLREGRAQMLLDPDDLIEAMARTAAGLLQAAGTRRIVQGLRAETPWFGEIDRDLRAILRVVRHRMTPQAIAAATGVPPDTLATHLSRARILGLLTRDGQHLMPGG